jgi:ammonium transporter, Amt family
VTTNTAAAMGALTWVTMSWARHGTPSVLGAAVGAVAGLVAITPAAGFVTPMGAILIGLGAGVFCYLAVQLKGKLKVDDSLDVWAVHGVGGIWGALATGLFATTAVNADGANGLFYGNPELLWIQMIAVVVVGAYAMVMTFGIMKVLDVVLGLRVPSDHEQVGLDSSQHGEVAYQL